MMQIDYILNLHVDFHVSIQAFAELKLGDVFIKHVPPTRIDSHDF